MPAVLCRMVSVSHLEASGKTYPGPGVRHRTSVVRVSSPDTWGNDAGVFGPRC